jgi:hypothetical protein
MPILGFEPTTLVFKWAKTVHALDHAATVIGSRGTLQPGMTYYVILMTLFQTEDFDSVK